MDRKERYINQLEILNTEATKTIDAIKNSENLLHDITASSIDELKRVYIEEAKRFLDRIGRRRLGKIEQEESKLGPKIIKAVMGISSKVARDHETESDRRLSTGLAEGYWIDETKKEAVEHAIEIVKRSVEDQVSEMSGEEFLKTVKGARSMHRMLRSQFDEEFGRLYRAGRRLE